MRGVPRLTRRRFLALTGTAAAAGVGAFGYARWVEPGWTEVVRRDMPIAGLPRALANRTLAHISDLHVGSTDPNHLISCLELVSSFDPDLVAITGDFMTCVGREQVNQVPTILARLIPPPLGCFAVLGNHDYGSRWHRADAADLLARKLNDHGVHVLRNKVQEVAGLQIAGVDDLWAGRCRPEEAVHAIDPKRPALALCHNPDSVDDSAWKGFSGWMLAGHTHGGQCKPPCVHPPILNLQNRRYSSGVFDLGAGRTLYVNRGLGYVQKVRFNARPEITLFRLVPA